jgi:hypothetical protein
VHFFLVKINEIKKNRSESYMFIGRIARQFVLLVPKNSHNRGSAFPLIELRVDVGECNIFDSLNGRPFYVKSLTVVQNCRVGKQ